MTTTIAITRAHIIIIGITIVCPRRLGCGATKICHGSASPYRNLIDQFRPISLNTATLSTDSLRFPINDPNTIFLSHRYRRTMPLIKSVTTNDERYLDRWCLVTWKGKRRFDRLLIFINYAQKQPVLSWDRLYV